jgi:long-chain acyl-CoA synthetase
MSGGTVIAGPPALATRYRNAVELFGAGEREHPDAPAIFYYDAQLTFREAGDAARAFARSLQRDLGVQRGDRVAVMLQNVPQMPIALHAIWLAGAIATPVNAMNKRHELVHQLSDAQVRVIVCMESLYETVATVVAETPLEHVVTVSELDYLRQLPGSLLGHERIDCPGGRSFAELVAAHAGRPFAAADPAPTSAALITYTSGTTGRPKGAVNTHAGVAYNAELWAAWYDLGPTDVAVAMAPLFHITGMMGHLAAARAAMSPLLLTYRFDAGELLELIERRRGSWIVGPLTAFIALLEHPELSSRDLSSLTKIASGGAPVAQAVVERFEQATGTYIHNAYGLTESTSAILLVPFGERAPVDPDDGAVSVGVPVHGAQARVVDLAEGHDLAPGQDGELLLRGPMVVPGYWARPDATKDAIRDGWFHTGDVARRDTQGWFWIVDRVKDMIIASGYKVWPREVEDVLYQHPAIAEASVVGVPDDYRGESVRAYVVLKRGAEATEAEIIAHCRERLAVYKAPHEVELVDSIPKTSTGKTLRRELRRLAQPRTSKEL